MISKTEYNWRVKAEIWRCPEGKSFRVTKAQIAGATPAQPAVLEVICGDRGNTTIRVTRQGGDICAVCDRMIRCRAGQLRPGV